MENAFSGRTLLTPFLSAFGWITTLGWSPPVKDAGTIIFLIYGGSKVVICPFRLGPL